MKQDTKLRLVWLLLFAVIGLFAFLNLEALNLTGEQTHHVTALGQNWSLAAPWGDGSTCGRRGSTVHTDASTTEVIQVSATLPSSGSTECGTFTGTVSVRLDSLNLQDYQKVVISRSATLSGNGDDGASYSVSTNGIAESREYRSNTNIVNKQLGDVFITNDGTVIRIQTAEGSVVLDATKEQFFTDSVSMSLNDPDGGRVSYTITRLELTPFPSVAPAPTTPFSQESDHGMSAYEWLTDGSDWVVVNDDNENTSTSQGEDRPWYSRFWEWLKQVF